MNGTHKGHLGFGKLCWVPPKLQGTVLFMHGVKKEGVADSKAMAKSIAENYTYPCTVGQNDV